MAESERLSDVVAAGERRRSLEALRDVLALSIEYVDREKIAPLAKQLTDVLREIDGLREPEGSALDDLASRRAARLADATGTDSP